MSPCLPVASLPLNLKMELEQCRTSVRKSNWPRPSLAVAQLWTLSTFQLLLRIKCPREDKIALASLKWRQSWTMCEEVELIPGNTKRPLKRNGCWVTLWFERYGELEVVKHLVLMVLRLCIWCTRAWHSTAERSFDKKIALVCFL